MSDPCFTTANPAMLCADLAPGQVVAELLAYQDAHEGYWYLGGPYTHKSPAIMELCAIRLTKVAAGLTSQGVCIVSPITEGHQICVTAEILGLKIGRDAASWERRNRALLQCSLGLLVWDGPGWRLSVGLREETRLIREIGKPVVHVSYSIAMGKAA
ncbi:MAG: DUF1937 family protein [Deltaproteobacteria bacterium]|nr:DUF1937 family protein [Deltaproteobacteria bacterium]